MIVCNKQELAQLLSELQSWPDNQMFHVDIEIKTDAVEVPSFGPDIHRVPGDTRGHITIDWFTPMPKQSAEALGRATLLSPQFLVVDK